MASGSCESGITILSIEFEWKISFLWFSILSEPLLPKANIMQKYFVLFRTQRNYTFIGTPDTFLDIFHAFPSCFLNLVKRRKISGLFLDSNLVFYWIGTRVQSQLIIIKMGKTTLTNRTQLRTSVLPEKHRALQREHWALQSFLNQDLFSLVQLKSDPLF